MKQFEDIRKDAIEQIGNIDNPTIYIEEALNTIWNNMIEESNLILDFNGIEIIKNLIEEDEEYKTLYGTLPNTLNHIYKEAITIIERLK